MITTLRWWLRGKPLPKGWVWLRRHHYEDWTLDLIGKP